MYVKILKANEGINRQRLRHETNSVHLHKNTGGKFLKKLWCCVGGRVKQGNLVLSTELITLICHRRQGVKLIFFSDSHLAPKFLKVVAN